MPDQSYEEIIDAFEALFGKHPGFAGHTQRVLSARAPSLRHHRRSTFVVHLIFGDRRCR
jgi:hypothetical protein